MFGRDSQPSRIWSFDVKAIVEGEETACEQIRLAHRYRNTLIALERRRRAATDAVIAGHSPELSEVEREIRGAEDAIAAVYNAINARSVGERRRVRSTREEREQLSALKDRRRGLFARRKGLRATLFADPDVREKLDVIDAEDAGERKAARSGCGLYWGTYLQIEQSLRGIKAGPPPEFRTWPGGRMASRIAEATGCGFDDALAFVSTPDLCPEAGLAVQIQKGMEWSEALLCRDNRVRVEIEPVAARPTHSKSGRPLPRADPDSNRSRSRVRAVVWVRVGSSGTRKEPVWLRLLTHLHRQPPPGTLIKWVFVRREADGPEVRWKVQFVLSRESGWTRDDLAAPGSPACGIDVNWRSVPLGLSVAYAHGEDGSAMHLILPRPWLYLWRKAAEIDSTRDLAFNEMRDRLAGWIAGEGREADVPGWLATMADHLGQWRSKARLAALARYWRSHRFPGDESIFGPERWGHADRHLALLGIWEAQDRHLASWQAGLHSKAIALRNDLYRKFARRVARRFRVAVLEEINYREMREHPEPGVEDQPLARVYHQVAAPGLLATYLREAVAETISVPPENTTKGCHVCGKIDEFDAAREVVHACSGCGSRWHQDHNAAINILRRGMEPAGNAAAAE